MVSSEITAENVESSLATIDDMEDIEEWQDLPAEITALIQDQPGLRFNTRPLNSREDLERAYDLLHDFIPGWDDSSKTFGIGNLAMSVLFAYGRMISRNRRPHMDELVVFRGAPYDILSRRCSGCCQQVLDIRFHTGPSTTPAFMYHGQLQAAAETLAVGFLTLPSNHLIIKCAGLQRTSVE